MTGIYYPVAACHWLARGFRAAGWEVARAGPCLGPYVPGGKLVRARGVEYAIEWPHDRNDRPTYADFCAKTGQRFDLVVQCAHRWRVEGVPDSVPHVGYGPENHILDYDLTGLDVFVGGTSWGRGSGDRRFRWYGPAYDPLYHYDERDFWDRPVDVALVGSLVYPRQEHCQLLAAHGFSVLTAEGLVWGAYNDAYNAAKVALVVPSAGDLTQRVFENTMQGCAVLMAGEVPDAAKMGLVDGEHYLRYDGDADMVRQAERLLDVERWRRMTEAAKEVVGPRTWRALAERMAAEVGL